MWLAPRWPTQAHGRPRYTGRTATQSGHGHADIALFTARRSNPSVVFGVVILSVRPSVRHTHVLWQNRRDTAGVLIPNKRAITLSFFYTNRGGWATYSATWNLRWKWPTLFEKRRLRYVGYEWSAVSAPWGWRGFYVFMHCILSFKEFCIVVWRRRFSLQILVLYSCILSCLCCSSVYQIAPVRRLLAIWL